MDTEDDWLLNLIMILFLVGGLLAGYGFHDTVDKWIDKPNIAPNETISMIDIQPGVSHVLNQFAYANDNSSYILYENDCTHFSTNLVNTLRNNSFNATCVIGAYKQKGAHMWVRVYDGQEVYNIEATPPGTGIIDNETYNQDYKNAVERHCFKN